jgi:hypothetical protein
LRAEKQTGATPMQIKELATGLKFPEGPVAMDDGSVIVVEMGAGRITRVKPDGTTQTVASPGGGPNGLAVGPDGHLYCCNNGGNFEITEVNGLMIPGHTPASHKGGRIERINISTGKTEVLYSQCDGKKLIAPNDLVFDMAGGFWFTDHASNDADKRTHGGLYYAKADGSKITKVLPERRGSLTRRHERLLRRDHERPSVGVAALRARRSQAGWRVHSGEFRGLLSRTWLFRFAGGPGGRCCLHWDVACRRHFHLLAGHVKIRTHAVARLALYEHLLGRQGHEDGLHHHVVNRKTGIVRLAFARIAADL